MRARRSSRRRYLGLASSPIYPKGAGTINTSRRPGAGGDQTTVEGGSGYAVRLGFGQKLHIVNTLGHQVVDTWALRLPGGEHHLSMSHTRLAIGRLGPRIGDTLVDDQRQPMLHLVEDTSGVDHDTLIPACDPQRYRALGHQGWHASCAENYAAAVTPHGLAPEPVPDPLNLFMAVPVSADREFRLAPSSAPAGSKVVLQAAREVLVIVSACPQDLIPINGAERTPRRIDVYLEDAPTMVH
jgi:uncharacterized protein YcgI (DUF1989 family)